MFVLERKGEKLRKSGRGRGSVKEKVQSSVTFVKPR